MKKIILIVLLMAGAWQAKAQTAVYVCSQNGAWGMCYSGDDLKTCAYNKCIEKGGQSPYLILDIRTKGYGAVAVGHDANGRQIVGAAAGYSSKQDAHNRAIAECQRLGGQGVSIYTAWLDD